MGSNGNESSSSAQRLLIGAGTLIVVILTVVGAVFLAMQETPDQSTPVTQLSPTLPPPTPFIPTFTPTSRPSLPTPSLTPTPIPDISPTATAVPVIAATATETPSPTASPTNTPVTTPAAETPPQPEPTPLPPAVPTVTPGAYTVVPCEPPATWVQYSVQVGDTLNKLSGLTGVSVADLQLINCLDSFTIRPDQTIYLPFVPPTVTTTPTFVPTSTRGPTPTRTATPIAPRITLVVVDLDLVEDKIKVFVTGENFRSREQGFRAELTGPSTIRLDLGEARTSTSFEATAPLDQLLLGNYDLVVINPNGRFDIRENVYPPQNTTPTPTPGPPEIIRVIPSTGLVNSDVRLTIQGRNFEPLEPGFRVELQLDDGSFSVDLPVDEGVRPATSTSFDVLVTSGTLIVGVYDMLVTNPDGQTDIERFAYEAIN